MIARIFRYSVLVGALLVAGLASLLAYWEHENAVDVPFPTDAELRSSFSRATAWTVDNGKRLLDEDNPMLWLFVREAGRLSGDPRLLELASTYQSRHIIGTVSQFFFDPTDTERVRTANSGRTELGYPLGRRLHPEGMDAR
jgi:hypothetical protein